MKGIKLILASLVALTVLFVGARDGLAEDPAIARGLEWLQAQVLSNGSLVDEDASLAVTEQARSEVAHTLTQAGRTAALPDLGLRQGSELSTELLARRAIGLGAIGRSQEAADVASLLMNRANVDGGFGGAAGQPSNPLDTSLALLAMRAGGVTRHARSQAALGYLGNAASADGSYSLGQSAYVTAYALQAFARYRNDYSLATVMQRTRAALLTQQGTSGYGDTVSNAVAVIALSQTGAPADAAPAATALRNAQAANGSWDNDAYVTALALRALLVASNPPSTNPGAISGEVYAANSGLPVDQAQIALTGVSGTYVSGPDGKFNIENLPAGNYSFTIVRAGYENYSGTVAVEGGTTSQLGRILLQIADNTGSIRGIVTDSRTAAPLAGVLVQVSGPLNTQTQTNAQGGYELLGLPAGTYGIQLTLAGYQPLNQTADLPARTLLSFSPALMPVGETPPTDASATGLVVRAGDGAPIAGATVTIGARSAVTGSDGRFAFSALPIGAFNGDASASGYGAVTFTGILAAGANDLGRIPLSSAQTARSVIGTVTSSATGQPIAGAIVSLNGNEAARTDASGQYRIDDTGTADVALSFDAAGYQSRTATTRLENPGVYRIDAALDDLLEGSFQVLNLRTTPSSLRPGASLRIDADIVNLNSTAQSALLLVRLFDANGGKVAQFCGAEAIGLPEQCEFAFDPRQAKTFAAGWVAANLPAGRYTLAVHAVEPGSANASNPLGLVYGLGSREITIETALGLDGSVTPSPPVLIPGSASGVDLTATVRNTGNDVIPAGQARLRVTRRSDGALAHEATVVLPELLPNDITELDFGNWQPPATGAEYDLRVSAVDPAVAGVVVGEFFVGDAAHGEFQVTPMETGDGTQRVQATLTVTGVDNRTGQGSDPLFALVRQAVTRGGAYTGVNARNWQNSNQCLGCHIQTQSLYGLASSLDKADIDRSFALFMQNSQSANIQSDRSIYQAHPGFRQTSSILGLWSMTAWPNRRSTFNARYRVADYLYGTRVSQSAGVYWWRDHDTGWLVENTAPTATVVEGIAGVLHDAERFGVTQLREYRAVQRATAPVRLVDLASGPDGLVYALQADGRIQRFDPATNAFSLYATAQLGASYTSIAVAADDSVYVGATARSGQPPVIERVGPGGSTAVATLPFYADALDVTHDNRIVTLNRGQRSVYLANPADGSVVRISNAGLISTSAATLTAAADGGLLISNDPGTLYGAIRIERSGAQSRILEGGLYWLGDLALAGDGRMVAGGGDAFYEIDADGVAERFTGPGARSRVAVVGGKVYALSSGANTALFEVEAVNTDVSARLAAMRVAMYDTARYFETYPNLGVPAEAFRLIMLAETRPFLTDAALIQRVDARIPQLAQSLRAAQRADGGWSRFAGQGSDPLTTAIVGTALDYTDPLPTDPVLRKTVQYLLTTQSSDGSWSGQYFSTRLGATSYVMAYLPKAVARLGGIDVGLGLDFGPDTRLVSSSVTANSSTTAPDGTASYFFNLGRIGSAGASFTFVIDLISMRIDEWRKIAKNAFLRFVNSFTGEQIDAPIAIPTVHAVSKYQLSLVLNRYTFNAQEEVIVQPTVRNGGSTYTSGSLRYFIETAEGAAVAELPVVAFSNLTTGGERTLPQPWNTGATPAGPYRARVVLLSPDGQVLGEATQTFTILTTSGGPQLTSSVATDRPIYDPVDTVRILGKVRNTTLNYRFENLTVAEAVTTPAGDTLWTGSSAVISLGAGASVPANFALSLTAAPAGVYTVTQRVLAENGDVLDTRTAQFEVRSTEVGGSGLGGTIAAVPEQVETGETTSLVITVLNRGNAALTAVPLVISVVDVDNETVLVTWTQPRDLPVGQSVSFAQPWATNGVAAGAYRAVLQARVGGVLVNLAEGPVRVIEPPLKAEMSQSIVATGRLLVLISCMDNQGGALPAGTTHVASSGDRILAKAHENDACVGQRIAFVDQLLTRLGIPHRIVNTGPAFVAEYATGRYDMYWVSGGAEKLSILAAEELREAVYQGDGLLVDGAHDARNQILNDALGVSFQGHLAGNAHDVVTSGDFAVGTFRANGDAVRYQATTARVQGRFDSASGVPAFFVNDHGLGGSAVAGFDLVAALAAASTSAQTETLLLRSLAHIAPPTPAYGVAGGYLAVRTGVRNLGSTAPFVLRHTAAAPLRIEDGAPVPATLTSGLIEWSFPLAVAESRNFTIGLRLPQASGTYALETLLSAGNPPRPLLSRTLPLTVVQTRQMAVALDAELGGLAPTTQQDRNARDRARNWLDQATDAMAAGNRDAAVGYLLKTIQELSKISSVQTGNAHVLAATLVKAARVGHLP